MFHSALQQLSTRNIPVALGTALHNTNQYFLHALYMHCNKSHMYFTSLLFSIQLESTTSYAGKLLAPAECFCFQTKQLGNTFFLHKCFDKLFWGGNFFFESIFSGYFFLFAKLIVVITILWHYFLIHILVLVVYI